MTEQEINALLQQAADLYRQGQLDEVADILRGIKREDSPKQYAIAQFNLGIALKERGDIDEAMASFRNVKHEYSPELYAMAQVNIGVILGKQEDTEGAMAAYQNVKREDSPEQYAKAQLNLGAVLVEQSDTEGAIAAFRNIEPEDSRELYVTAQVNLGITLEAQGNTEEAIAIYRSVARDDSPKQYAKAQLNIGVILGKQEDTEGAMAAYQNVKREDSPEQYAKAQFNLSGILRKQGNIEGEIAAYQNIQPNDSQEVYATAQVNLGSTLAERGDTKEAIAAFRNIAYQDLEDTKTYKEYYYQFESRIKIANCTSECAIRMVRIPDFVENLILKLLVNKNKKITEAKVAHYTRPSTAGVITKHDSPSKFRLSTIKNVNDPSEGAVFYQYVEKSGKLPPALTNEADNTAAAVFLSCFTFNHDSLNQFRLYGKENGQEASGVSLVFNDSFFSGENPFAMLSANLNTIVQNFGESGQSKPDHAEMQPLPKLPLFRCIYLDPQSGYLSVAHRDKVTFYAEAWHNNKTADHEAVCGEAEEKWVDYQLKIDELSKEIKTKLAELAQMVRDAAEDAEDDVLKILAFILQPLRYLVKHVAFQEEQECRMIYIGNLLNDKRIHTDWNARQMYFEYSVSVRDSLNKIYLSPGAEPYADFFKRSLPELAKNGSIRRSQNPFRNK